MSIESHPLQKFRILIASIAAICLCAPASAQTSADIQEAARQAEQLQRQARDQIRKDIQSAIPAEPAPSGIDTRALQPKVDASAAGAGCREIREINISGAPNLSRATREHITRTFTGRCIGAGDIEQILGEITQDYVKRGLITTRAYLPRQDLSSGKLEILVVEGTIGKILIEDGDRNSVAGNAVPSEAGDVLNLRDLEQGIEQINKLGSNNARLDIQPGERPGESVVVIHNSPGFPLHASFSADNHGMESTGKNQIGLTVTADGLLRLNELMAFTHRESWPHDLGRKYSGSNSFVLAVPFGYSLLSLALSRSKYVSTLHAPSGLDLKSDGNSATNSVSLERVIYRDQDTRWSLSGAFSTKSSKNYLADQFLAVSSRDLTTLDVDSSVTQLFLGGTASFGIGYTKGLRLAGALEDPAGLPDDAPRAQFGKYRYSLQYNRPFQMAGSHFSFSTSLIGQIARSTLYGSEQIGIGGNSTVRGFVNNTLSGDTGYFIRNEIAMHPTFGFGDISVPARIFAGLDFGAVKNRAAGVPEGSLTGMAIGVSAVFKGASIEVFTGKPLRAPGFFNLEPARTWVRISYAI